MAMYADDLDQATRPSSVMTTLPARPAAGSMAIWAGLFTLYLVWGSTYLGIRVAVETIPPFLMAGVRFLISGLTLVAVELALAARRRGDPTIPEADRARLPTAREWRDSAIVGGALLLGGMGFVALGEKTVPSGIAAILVALLPLWVAVLGRVFFGERLPRAVVFGIAVGLVGVVVLVGPFGGSGGPGFDPFGIFILLLSPLCWGAGSLFSTHRAVLPRRPLLATGLQMLCGGALLVVGGVVVGELNGFDPAAVTSRSLLGLAYLTTVGSLVGFTTYVWLLRVAPLPKIATYAYVNPVVAVALGALLLGERVEPRTFVGAAVIVFAVALIVTARGRAARAAAVETAAEEAGAFRPSPAIASSPSPRGSASAPSSTTSD